MKHPGVHIEIGKPPNLGVSMNFIMTKLGSKDQSWGFRQNTPCFDVLTAGEA